MPSLIGLLPFLLLFISSRFCSVPGLPEPFYSSASIETDFRRPFPAEDFPVPATPLGWTRWSEWSECTRKCGGEGVQYQLRRCLDLYCSGPSARHRICGKEECVGHRWPNSSNSSASIECSLRSSSRERLVATTTNDCSLRCVNQRTGQPRAFNVSLRDGTKCQLKQQQQQQDPAQRAACLDGKCRPVGCDDIIGSAQRTDQCGVCGGDGSSCARELFRWRDTGHFSPCDKSCGPNGVRVSVSACINTRTERVVPERMCADQQRPRPVVRRCPHIVCPAKPSSSLTKHLWITGDWGDCSVTCGAGEQRREVFCAEDIVGSKEDQNQSAGERHRVADQYCWPAQKPSEMRTCGDDACPEWSVGEWSDCSASCGRGIRRRTVECRRGDAPFHPFYCVSPKPAEQQPCWAGTECNGRPTDQKQQSLISYTEDDQTAEDEADGKPKFFAGPWADCSASCGTGIRSRLVECMGGGLRLPDYECQGQPRPAQFQPCSAMAPCPVALAKSSPIRSLSEPFGFSKPSEAGFRWEHGEWTRCSASCLGGKQKAPVVCMDVARRVHVPWANCDAAHQPQELTRACNRHACAPEWEIGPWSDCSHACGAGLRTRRVRCARAVSRSGAARTLIVPDAQCAGQRPGDEEPCGMVDCAPEWLTGHWGQCSSSCGSGGEQRRPLRCVRRDSLGQVLDLEDAECRTDQRPATVRLCNMGPCPTSHAFSYEEGPFGVEAPTVASPQSLALTQSKDEPMAEDGEEEAEEHPHHRKLTLKVGGFANLYEGTSVKVKCPVKDNKSAGRRRVVWSRDGRRIENSPHVKVSANGALRIFHAQMADAGVYACHTVDGHAQGNVTLRFKPGVESSPRHKSAINRTTKQQRESQKSMELLQRVRNNLYRLGQHSLLQRLTTVSDPAEVRVEFAASAWAECRQLECGHGEGVQVRLLKCQIHIGTDAAYVGDDICEAFGIPRPPATRPCTDERCPRWQSGPWSDCAESRCVRHATALQRREVRCMHANNGTLAADASLCDRRSRPKLKRECENANCSAEWRPSVWGACSKRCGDGGVQMRLLRCVWHGTRKPAGRACEPEARPSAIRACDRARGLPPCPEEEDAENETRKKNNGENSASNDGEDEEKEGTKESGLGEDTLTSREIGTDEERVEVPETELNGSETQFDASGVGTLANESGNITQDDESGTGTQADLSGDITQSDASRAELQTAVDASGSGTQSDASGNATRLRDEPVRPFVGWQRWRGWRLYGWRPPTHFGGVSDASGDGGMRRRF